ncbi:MAG: hypothetical protein GY851_01880 [bacterium]|nr:hypothetical protein [bacterium]
MHTRWIHAAALLALAGCSTTSPKGDMRDRDFAIIGYLPEYQWANVPPETGRYLTDVILFSIEPREDGTLDSGRATTEFVARVQDMKRQHGTRILVALGGWGRSTGFGAMATDKTLRSRFVSELTDYCLANGFDGADYDWEFPENAEEKAAYSDLIVDTKRAFEPHGLLVTVALNRHQRLSDRAYAALDRIHLMAYDGGRRHSAFEHAQAACDRFVRDGVPPAKIGLGVPFYGRRMANTDEAMAYQGIVEQFAPSLEDDEAGGFYYNGPAMMRRKTRLAFDNGLSGIMIWEIGQDTHDDSSLLRTIKDEADKAKRGE